VLFTKNSYVPILNFLVLCHIFSAYDKTFFYSTSNMERLFAGWYITFDTRALFLITNCAFKIKSLIIKISTEIN
jgi:hypothetical protein